MIEQIQVQIGEKQTMKKFLIISVLSVSLFGCLTSGGVQNLATSDQRACAQNFTFDGSFIAGRTFKTSDFVEGVSKQDAVERAAQHLNGEGRSITSTDKDLGIISASQGVSFGEGKTVPLNVGIQDAEGGVNVDVTFKISGGTTTPAEGVRDGFCDTIEAIASA